MRVLRADKSFLQQARQAKQEVLEKILGSTALTAAPSSPVPPTGNVLGVGYGAKVTVGAAVADELAVRVYVRSKLPESALAAGEKVPAFVNNIPTDVVPVGDITAFPRPTPCGVSVGHPSITVGTLGCLVRKTKRRTTKFESRVRYILSNNHVLANCNNCATGDQILEPGPMDGGTIAIAELTEWEPILFGSGVNKIDAAIAKVLDPPT